jgi:hypothetical protein
MNDPTTAPRADSAAAVGRSHFRLPLVAWLAWALYAGWLVTRVSRRPGGPTSADWTAVAGFAAGTLVASILAAWIAGRFARHPNRARTTAFFAVLAVVAGTQFTINFSRGPTRAAWLRIAEDHQQSLAERSRSLAAGQPLDPKADSRHAEQLAANLRTAADNSSGETKAAAEAGQVLAEALLAANHRYNAAVAQLNLGTFFELAPLAQPAARQARRELVKEFALANAALRETQVGGAAILQRELEKRGVSLAFSQSTVASYAQNASARVGLLEKIRLTDAQLAALMDEFLDLADGRFGPWRVADATGQVVFENTTASARAAEMQTRLQAIGSAQAGYQKQLMGGR